MKAIERIKIELEKSFKTCGEVVEKYTEEVFIEIDVEDDEEIIEVVYLLKNRIELKKRKDLKLVSIKIEEKSENCIGIEYGYGKKEGEK